MHSYYSALPLAQTGTGSGGSSALANLLPFVLLAVAFWFLLVRPQRKRAQEAAQIRSSLRVGAEVVTTAGLYGTVAHVDDDAVLLEVAPGVTNRYAKGAIGRVLSTPATLEDGPDAEPGLDDPGPGSGPRDETRHDDGLHDDGLREDGRGPDDGPAPTGR